MRARPRLSVTVLNYNYGRYLPRCLDSILAQTMADFEVILIDDCSKDDSLAAIQPYLDDPRVRLVAHEQNAGYVRSLIEGTESLSTGEYLSVISADDMVVSPRAFELQVAALDANPEAAFCFSAFQKMDAATGRLGDVHRSFESDRVLRGVDFLTRYITDSSVQVLHTGCMIRAGSYRAAGGYRRDFRYAVDFAIWQMLATTGDVAFVAQPLYAYGIHESQMSSSFGGVHRSTAEVVAAVEASCRQAVAAGLADPSLLRRALGYSLYAVAMDDAFAGRTQLALRRCLTALRQRPLAALTARRLWIILLRVLLGERVYSRVRGAVAAAPA